MKTFLSKIEASDVFQLTGLSLFGTGFFFLFGHEWSLVATGGILMAIGFFGRKS